MDFYRVLGIARNATQKEINEAWRREALKNHPDRCATGCYLARHLVCVAFNG